MFLLIILNLILGFLLFVLKLLICELDMLVEDVVKLVILVGLVYLNGKDGVIIIEFK